MCRAAGSRRGGPCADPPRVPTSRSGTPLAPAIQAPSSTAAQSCWWPPNGTSTGAPAAPAPRCAPGDERDVAGARARAAPARLVRWARLAAAARRARRAAAARRPRSLASRTASAARSAELKAAVRAGHAALAPRPPARRSDAPLRRPARLSSSTSAAITSSWPPRAAAARPGRPARRWSHRSAGSTRIARAGAAPRPVEPQARVLREDPPLELLQVRARARARARRPAGDARRGRPRAPRPGGRAVEREHQLAAQPLAQRMLANERLSSPTRLGVAAERELGLDPQLESPPAAAPPGAAIAAWANGA